MQSGGDGMMSDGNERDTTRGFCRPETRRSSLCWYLYCLLCDEPTGYWMTFSLYVYTVLGVLQYLVPVCALFETKYLYESLLLGYPYVVDLY